MGLLDQLWDDTLAGPRPESGLGKLRKQSMFSFRPISGEESSGGNVRSDDDESPLEATKVTRSITIVKPPGYQNGSPPVSPAGSATPLSPFSGNRESCGFRRRWSTSEAYEKANDDGLRGATTTYNV